MTTVVYSNFTNKIKGSLFCLLGPVHFWSYSGLCHHPVDTTLYYRVEVNCLRGPSKR